MLPVLIIIAISVAIAAAAAATDPLGLLRGAKDSKVVLVGPRKAGKTTWKSFLTTGHIPEGYAPTQGESFVEAVALADLRMAVHVQDFAGNKETKDSWRKAAKSADRVYFFVDATRLSDVEYVGRSKEDAKDLSSWQLTCPVDLVATHADLVEGWPDDPDAVIGIDAVRELSILCSAERTLQANLGSDGGCREFTIEALRPFMRKEGE